ncbi:branched-chain amino acid ABC transporter permease [Chachezhania sediminis]|uniref:branched-chain amino acid ABC transporter permease n=1 Tax=Chachezhania sediminis TaxID=2599291 RepID=UPI0018EF0731|nr:branched-chain amino acid ABC transporter permease [Chachezhania sediminis]
MDIFLQQLVNGLSLGGTYALLAIGLAIIYSIMGLINFAHGDLMTLTGYAMIGVVALGLPFPVAILCGLVAATLAAMAMERIAFRPLRGASGASMLLSSLAVSTVLHIAFQVLISARPQALPFPPMFSGAMDLGFARIGNIQAISIVVAVLALIVVNAILYRLPLGIAIRAAAQDFDATRVMGVQANRLISLAFGLSGVLAGIAGVLWIAQRGSVDPALGFNPVIKAFIAVTLGGLGSLQGAVLGGLFLGLLEVFLRAYLPEDTLPYREAVALTLVVFVLLFRPQGFMGKSEAVR